MDRETHIHTAMAQAGLRAARDWDAMTPGEYHAAALSDLCESRGLPLSSGCRMCRDCRAQVVVECDTEGGSHD